MAEGKNKIIFYKDWGNVIKKLTDEEAGKLIKHFCHYVDDEDPESPDRITELLFEPIKATLKRDLKKWEVKSNVNKMNGAKGGRPKLTEITQTVNKKPNGLNDNPKKGVSDSVSVIVSDSVTDKVNEIVKDKVKETLINSIDSRKLKFSSTLEPYLETYGRSLLNDFYSYWTEPNKSKTKFKQELEKTWSLERRLSTWANNDKNFNYGKKQPRNISQERIDALKKW